MLVDQRLVPIPHADHQCYKCILFQIHLLKVQTNLQNKTILTPTHRIILVVDF